MGFYQAQKIEALEARVAELEAMHREDSVYLVAAADAVEALRARNAELERSLACSIVNGNDAREQCLEHAYALSAAGARIAELEVELARERFGKEAI